MPARIEPTAGADTWTLEPDIAGVPRAPGPAKDGGRGTIIAI